MKRLILITSLLCGMTIANQLFAALPGGVKKYSAWILLRDQNNNPVTSGVFVKLWVQTWYGEEGTYNCFKTGVTGSSGSIYLECLIPAENAEGLMFMEAQMTDPVYSVLSSQNTWTNYEAHINAVFHIVYDLDGDLVDDNLELRILAV